MSEEKRNPKRILKLVIYTEEDIMVTKFDENVKIIQKAIEENKFHLETINPKRR